MVQTGPSLRHPALVQLLYTTCKINKLSFLKKVLIIPRLPCGWDGQNCMNLLIESDQKVWPSG